MNGALTRVARHWWAGGLGMRGTALSVLLTPLSWLWRVGTGWRNRRHDRAVPERVPGVRVISVGNLAVGGTGKTPFTSWVARTVTASGKERAAIVLRGYGADEVALHRHWTPDVDVVADVDRVAATRRAAGAGAETVVVDDGFQHRRLGRDVDLVLLALEDPFPGRVLPCGPYREPATALARADGVILTRRTGSEEDARALADAVARVGGVRADVVLGCVHLVSEGLLPLDADVALPDPPRGPSLDGALAVTAIARPDTFRDTVAGLVSGPVELRAFGDHHAYTLEDARGLRRLAGPRPIVVTEKDAMKLRAFAEDLGETWVLRQSLDWDWGEARVRALLAGEARSRIEASGP